MADDLDAVAREWVDKHFGKKDGETTADAMGRHAAQPHPMFRATAPKSFDADVRDRSDWTNIDGDATNNTRKAAEPVKLAGPPKSKSRSAAIDRHIVVKSIKRILDLSTNPDIVAHANLALRALGER